MTQISDQTGGAITNMEPGKKGTRAYFDVDEIKAGAARVNELGGQADEPQASARHGLVRNLPRPPGKRVRPLAERPIRARPDLSPTASGLKNPAPQLFRTGPGTDSACQGISRSSSPNSRSAQSGQ